MGKKSRSELVDQLNKFSKEALIEGFIENNMFNADKLIRDINHAEIQIIIKKEDELMKEMRSINVTESYESFEKYKRLYAKYEKYDKQLKKLFNSMK